MLLHILNAAVAATERGLVPDVAIRFGIRKLLKERLREESRGSCEEWQHRKAEFIRQAKTGPIALVPELANEQHYEQPPEFFQRVLGKRLKYSSCYFPDEQCTLDRAEEESLRITCERAGIANGMSVLDLGCGWGSLSLWIAEHFPQCDVTSVSNSKPQREFIERTAGERKLGNIRVMTADMNSFAPGRTFDRVVSVEMFEHMRNHAELMRRISSWLAPGGKLFVHIFCHREFVYPFETEGAHNWMGRHFFSGGIMPSDDLLLQYQSDLKLENHWRWNGRHYERTCNAWLAKMDADRTAVLQLMQQAYGGDQAQRWFVRWRLFFMACAELFGYCDGNEWWVSHYLFEKRVESV